MFLATDDRNPWPGADPPTGEETELLIAVLSSTSTTCFLGTERPASKDGQWAVRLVQFRLVSAYLLSHNIIHSASRTLFTRSAEQPHKQPPIPELARQLCMRICARIKKRDRSWAPFVLRRFENLN